MSEEQAPVLFPNNVVDVLTALVDKSLVIYEETRGEGRYRLLETVRQYARERLAESGEAVLYRNRHREYFLALAEDVVKKLKGPGQGALLNRMEIEHDNLRQALRLCLETSDGLADGERGEIGLRLGAAMQRYWHFRGHLSEGRECLTDLLARPETQERTTARAEALDGAGRMAYAQGDYAYACSLYEESLEIRRELGDREGIAYSLVNLGESIWYQGDYASARSLHEEGLEMFRELNNQEGIAHASISLGNLAWTQGDYVLAQSLFEECGEIFRKLGNPQGIAVASAGQGLVAWNQGDFASARSLFEKSLTIRRELGDRHGIAGSLNNLGLLAWTQGDYVSTRPLIEESLKIRRELGERNGIALSCNNLGSVIWKLGDFASARSLFRESLELFRDLGNPQGIALSLKSFASMNAEEAKNATAARLWGAAERLREEINSPMLPSDQADYDREVASVRAALGREDFAAAWAEGRNMTMEQASQYVLDEFC